MSEPHDTVLAAARVRLTQEEGRRLFPYTDTAGQVTIGIGHNLTARGLSSAMVDELFTADLEAAWDELVSGYDWFAALDPTRMGVMVDLMFNLGASRLRSFNIFLGLMARGLYHEAAADLRLTKWASQVGARAERLCQLLEA